MGELDSFLGKWEIPKLTKNKKKSRTDQSWVKKLKLLLTSPLSLQSSVPILLYSWAPQSIYRVKNPPFAEAVPESRKRGEKKKLSDSFNEGSLTVILKLKKGKRKKYRHISLVKIDENNTK